jgi:hypothetical protein
VFFISIVYSPPLGNFHLSPTQSTSYMHTCSESPSSYAHGYSEYLALDSSETIHDVQWVYEWENPEFYSMLVSEWQIIATWTGQSWEEYKVSLLATQRIALMSTIEHHMTHYTWLMPHWYLCIWSLCTRVVVLLLCYLMPMCNL